MSEFKKIISTLKNDVSELNSLIDFKKLKIEIDELEEKSQSPDIWNDRKVGTELMTSLASKKSFLEKVNYLNSSVESYYQLLQDSNEDEIKTLEKDSMEEINNIKDQITKLETELQFSGEHDQYDVLITISGGAGGVDAQDWASMLLRMYVRWADKKNFKAEILTSSPGEEAGIKSALLRITGEKVFGLLKGEKGVHRLVRLSPFNSANLRHTSFALVEVIPDFQKTVNVEVNNDDLKIEAFKASGAGGQSVQKNSSAIRLTHKPSGIVVSVQNERSQSQNKNIALQILKSRLVDLENIKNKEKENELKGEFVSAEWGNQVRSYVLHPYTLVKDIRSGFELSDAQKVLDGDLDQLLFEFLKFINKSQNHN